jgi:hypothetical protein
MTREKNPADAIERGAPSPATLERMKAEGETLERFARREAEHLARLEANPAPWTGDLERLD